MPTKVKKSRKKICQGGPEKDRPSQLMQPCAQLLDAPCCWPLLMVSTLHLCNQNRPTWLVLLGEGLVLGIPVSTPRHDAHGNSPLGLHSLHHIFGTLVVVVLVVEEVLTSVCAFCGAGCACRGTLRPLPQQGALLLGGRGQSSEPTGIVARTEHFPTPTAFARLERLARASTQKSHCDFSPPKTGFSTPKPVFALRKFRLSVETMNSPLKIGETRRLVASTSNTTHPHAHNVHVYICIDIDIDI